MKIKISVVEENSEKKGKHYLFFPSFVLFFSRGVRLSITHLYHWNMCLETQENFWEAHIFTIFRIPNGEIRLIPHIY